MAEFRRSRQMGKVLFVEDQFLFIFFIYFFFYFSHLYVLMAPLINSIF